MSENIENKNMEETTENIKEDITEKSETAEEVIPNAVNETTETEAPVIEYTAENTNVNNNAQNGYYGGFDYRFGYPDQINKGNYKTKVNVDYQNVPPVDPQAQYYQQAPQSVNTVPQQEQYNANYSADQPYQYNYNYNIPPQYPQGYNPQNGYNNYGMNYPYHQKNRLIAGLFGVLLGGIGLHNFYLGYTGRAVAQLLVTVFTLGFGSIWGFIEGLLIISDSYKDNLDANGVLTKEI